MEELGEQCFINSKQTGTYYKIVGLKDDEVFYFTNFIVQECYLKLVDKTLSVLDENKKTTKIVETYEKIPFGRRKLMNIKLFQEMFPDCDGHDYVYGKPYKLYLSDKYCYKDSI